MYLFFFSDQNKRFGNQYYFQGIAFKYLRSTYIYFILFIYLLFITINNTGMRR